MTYFFFLAFALFGWALQGLGFVMMLWFSRQKAPKFRVNQALPGVSLIKPCLGAKDNEAENFKILFRQKYSGPIQILFSVSREDDEVIPVIRDLQRKYPEVNAEIVISTTRQACHLKVDALYDAQEKAQNEVIIWSDSDAIVKENYIQDIVASLQDPEVGVVTTPQLDTRWNNLATGWKGVGNNTDVAVYVSLYMLKRVKCAAWGHSIAFRKSDFDRVKKQAWEVLNRFIVDDQAIPYIFTNFIKKKVSYRHIYCPVQWSNKTFFEVFRQKKYWAMFQKAGVGNELFYLSGVLLYPQIPATFALILGFFDPLSWVVFLGIYCTRMCIAVLQERIFLGTWKYSLKYAWSILFWDLSQLYFIPYGFMRKTIRHCGKEYEIVNRYFLEPVEDEQTVSFSSIKEKSA